MKRITIKEVTEKFDVDGNLIERVTRTETTEDDEPRVTGVTTLGFDEIYTDSPTYPVTCATTAADAPTTKTRSGIGVK